MSAETPTIQPSQPVFDPENPGLSLDRLQAEIPLSARWLSGTIIGDTPSLKKGKGFEFDGVRDYMPGDDVRYIDWPATARQTMPGQPPAYRVHFQDIKPALWIVTDVGQSRNHVENPRDNPGEFPEQLLASSAIMALVRIAHTQKRPWGLIASDDQGIAFAHKHPKLGRSHMLATADRLAELVQPDEPTPESQNPYSLAELLTFAGRQCTGSIVAVVSDFRDEAAPKASHDFAWEEPARRLGRNNELLSIETTTPWDFILPETDDRFMVNGSVRFIGGGERGELNRARYAADARRQDQAIHEALMAADATHITLRTEEGRWLDALRAQLTSVNHVKAYAS